MKHKIFETVCGYMIADLNLTLTKTEALAELLEEEKLGCVTEIRIHRGTRQSSIALSELNVDKIDKIEELIESVR